MVDVDLEFENSVSVSSVGPVGPVTIAGIPDPINISVLELPKILLGSDPETPLAFAPLTLTLKPIDLNISLKEVPSMRTHLPADFCVGLSVLGFDVLAVKLCGEAQLINEPYEPNPCEVCGREHRSVPGAAAVMHLQEQ
jgi:hypothetical protein